MLRRDNPARLLRSTQVEHRLRAVRMLAERAPHDARALLGDAVCDPSAEVASRAAKVVGDLGLRSLVPRMVQRWRWLSEAGVQRDPGCAVRSEMALALGKMRADAATSALREGIRTVQIEMVYDDDVEDTATGLRGHCAIALAQIAAPGTVVDLAVLFHDVRPNVPLARDEARYAKAPAREAAARAMAILKDPSAVPLLVARLAHPNGEVAEVLVACMDALLALDPKHGFEYVATYLEHRDPYLVIGAANALSATGSPHIPALLAAAVSGAPKDARIGIVRAIAAAESARAADALRDLVLHDDPRVREAAMAHLGDAWLVEDEVVG